MKARRFTILGAGLMGRLLAVSLSRQGHEVDLFEQGGAETPDSAAWAAAAMLAPLAESVATEPLVISLGIASLSRWPEILAALPGAPFFQQKGTLVVWHGQDRDQAALFSRQLRLLDDRLPEPGRARELTGPDLAELEPELGPRFGRGFYLPGEGQLDNRAVLESLQEAMAALPVRVHWHAARSPDQFRDGWVIDCRGLGAKPDWSSLRGVRGEVVRVRAPDVHLRRPIRLLHPRYPLYIAPKPDSLFVIGATQIESEDRSPVSVRSALELLSALYTVHPGFGEARILEMMARCRPTLPDNLPSVRWDGERLIRVNGLFRHGFMIAPALLEATLALIDQVTACGECGFETWCESQAWPALYGRLT